MNWYCIHTKPQKEALASEQLLEGLGLEVYFPCIRRRKLIRRVRKEVVGPLFPQYLFCRFDLETHFRAVRYARDVIDVLSFGARPTAVSDELIKDIKTWAEGPASIVKSSGYSQGDLVQVIKGPMQGLEATILEQSDDRDRVSVLLSILGCGAKLRIDRDQIDLTQKSLTNCIDYTLQPFERCA